MEIRDEIEKSISEGPLQGPVLDQLRLGKAAVRRRRLVTGVVGLALVAVVGGSAYAVAEVSGDADRSDSDFSSENKSGDQDWAAGRETAWVAFNGTGLMTDGRATVLRRQDRPLAGFDAEEQAAFVVRHNDGRTRWVFAWQREAGPSVTAIGAVVGVPGKAATTFEKWIAELNQNLPTASNAILPLRGPDMTGDGKLLVEEGTRVVRVVDDPAGPTSVAAITEDPDGVSRWTFYFTSDENGGGGTGNPMPDPPMTFDEWVAVHAAGYGDQEPPLVTLDGGKVVPVAGVELVRQRPSTAKVHTAAGAPQPPVVAEVVHEGKTWFVLAIMDLNQGGGPEKYLPRYLALETGPGRATLNEFDDLLSRAYDGGSL